MRLELRSTMVTGRKDGFVTVQLEPNGVEGQGASPEQQQVTPFGLLGRPRDADTTGRAVGLELRDGSEGFVLCLEDPRWQDALPDVGKGGGGFYGTIQQGTHKRASYVAIFGDGATGGEAAGMFRAKVWTPVGAATIEVNPATAEVTITHPLGALVKVTNSGVELGAAGGQPVALATPITAWAASVVSALAGAGITVPALATAGATLVKAT